MKTIQQRIQEGLRAVARDEQVTILYACESGSRAWGFPSANSDYDVRFIYLRPTHWYLTTQQKRDVIEVPIDDELDIAGWDLPKALQLLRKSNPPLLEWLQSPVVYHEQSTLRRRLRPLMRRYYSPISCMYHYLHMAENNYRKYLQGEQVWTKKYFYVLRPVLACIWIEQGFGVVPIEFGRLVEKTVASARLRREIDTLLRRKMAGEELDQGPRNRVVAAFLDQQMQRLRADIQPQPETRDPAILDQVFVDLLVEVNGTGIRQEPRGPAGGGRRTLAP